MNTRSLQVFCDVVRLRSVSAAATANGVTQGNVSNLLSSLEHRLGVVLVDRSKRPVVITPEGQKFYDGCRDIVAGLERLVREVRAMHEVVVQRVTVASIYSVGLSLMSQYVHEFRETHPQSEVRLEYLHPDRVLEVVDADLADFGVVSYPETTRSLMAIPWRREPLVLVCPPQHPLAERFSVPLEALRGERMVAFSSGLRIRDEIDRALSIRKIAVERVMQFDNIEIMKRAIECGSGVSLLPEPTINREVAAGTLVSVPLAGQRLERPIGIVYRRERPLSDAAQQLIDHLKSRAENSTSTTRTVTKPVNAAVTTATA